MKNLDGINVILVNHKIECEVFELNRPNVAHHDFTVCLSGKMRYTVGNESFCLGMGEAMYCPPGVSMTREGGDVASYISINFTTPSSAPLPINYHIHNVLSYETNSYIELISYFLRKNEQKSQEKLLHLVILMLLKVIEQQEISRPMPYVDRIKAYVKDNFQKDITLDTVAAFINLHPSYCSTIFKQTEGKSITEYINTMRINHAKELLETTNHRIGEVGAMCGIPDPYYFSRVFNKISGVSPTDYRKLAKTYGGKAFCYNTEEIKNGKN